MSLRKNELIVEERKAPFHQTFLKNFFYFKRDIKKFCFFKILIPFKYNKAKLKPIKEDKVIFMELTSPELTGSYKPLFNKLVSEYNLDIHVHFLMQGRVPKDELYRRQVAFVKDVATAKYVILNDSYNLCGALKKRKGAHIMNTWHAAGAFKRFGFSIADKKFGMDRHEMTKFPLHPSYDLVTVSSPDVEWAYIEAMGKEKEKDSIKGIGISRSDIFYDEEFKASAREHLYNLFPEADGKKVILYAPTFRGHVRNAESPDMMDMSMMREELSDDYVLLTKHHPFVKKRPAIADEDRSFAKDMSDLMSIEELLSVSDICISDYSSLIFEYSLFEKPMIFFVYDLANYFDWRGFYYDFEELTPGPSCYTNRELIDCIKATEKGFDIEKVRSFRKKFMSGCDGHATEKTFKEFFGNELDKYKREEILEGDFSSLPVNTAFYEYTERMNFLRKTRNSFRAAYEKGMNERMRPGSMALLIDEYTDPDSYKTLEEAAERKGIALLHDFDAETMTISEYAEALARTETLLVAGEPYLLRMIDIREETRVVQLRPEGITFYDKWNADITNKTGLFRENSEEFPIHTSYDMVTVPDEEEELTHIRKNYELKENAEILKIGNLKTGLFKDKKYIKESREYLGAIIPEAKNKKVITILPKERVGFDSLLTDFLIHSHEALASDYVLVVDTKNPKLIPEYLDGYAVSPHLRLTRLIEEGAFFDDEKSEIKAEDVHEFSTNSLIAAADIVISDYREEAVFALAGDSPLYIFAEDISTFSKKMGVCRDFEKTYEGILYKDSTALIRDIAEGIYNREASLLIKKTFLSDDVGKNSEVLFDHIKNLSHGGN